MRCACSVRCLPLGKFLQEREKIKANFHQKISYMNSQEFRWSIQLNEHNVEFSMNYTVFRTHSHQHFNFKRTLSYRRVINWMLGTKSIEAVQCRVLYGSTVHEMSGNQASRFFIWLQENRHKFHGSTKYEFEKPLLGRAKNRFSLVSTGLEC